MLVLHGVFGSSDNWQSMGKALAAHFTTYLIDQRNHGLSPHHHQMDYEVMSSDLLELMEAEGLKSAFVVGHSMGGKTAMSFAAKYPELVDKLVVVDIAPKYYPPHHQNILKGYRSIDLPKLETRKQAEEQLMELIPDLGVRQFILKNLHRDTDGTFSWKINLDAIEAHVEDLGQGLPSEAIFEKATLFIAGEHSNYIQLGDHGLIAGHFPQSKIVTVAGAGHWVHAEKPNEVAGLIIEFLA